MAYAHTLMEAHLSNTLNRQPALVIPLPGHFELVVFLFLWWLLCRSFVSGFHIQITKRVLHASTRLFLQ